MRALRIGDRLRVTRFVKKGEAPDDPQMAPAAIEVAEGFQRAHGRAYYDRVRWFVLLVMVVTGASAVWFATGGETMQAILNAWVALTLLGSLSISPMYWPKNVARSLEASRAVVGSDE